MTPAATTVVPAVNRPAPGERSPGHAVYIFPRHASEVDRLDLQHYAFREILDANYLAPIVVPEAILDVGCGTGLWASDLCADFPKAMVVGLDLVPSHSQSRSNYRFVRGNLLQGLPFADGSFDFVHQRLLSPGVPLRSWSAAIGELARVARPGGWVEVVEGTFGVEPAGEATTRLFELAWRLGRSLGLDTTGIIFRSLPESLRSAGLTDVQSRVRALPVGDWGGRTGSFIASDMRAAFTRLGDTFQTRFGVSAEEWLDLLTRMQREWDQHRTTWGLSVTYGRKPGAGAAT
jgi:SAM-dependent methyltransferase